MPLLIKKEYKPEFRIVWNDSSVHYINSSAIIERDNDGNAIRMIGTNWDVTKEIEAALEKERMIKELMDNNLELKQFSYITTHNLRAPLTNLVLICKLLSPEKIEDPSTLKLIEFLKTSTNQLNETLNDLINVLIVKDNTDLLLDELSFDEILDKVKESISGTLSDGKVIIETDFSDVPTVHFTTVYLESIFLNLITNSIKYRHPERNVVIKIKTIKSENGRTQLTFSDNGIGMDMSRVKHKIFGFQKRFHKNSDSKGIGLFLVKSQINASGGQIEVDSEVNIGSIFTITFK
nr:ATP-binding protein [uncultured Flavobacterium sp.]